MATKNDPQFDLLCHRIAADAYEQASEDKVFIEHVTDDSRFDHAREKEILSRCLALSRVWSEQGITSPTKLTELTTVEDSEDATV